MGGCCSTPPVAKVPEQNPDTIPPPPAKGEAWTADPTKPLPVRYAKSGIASQRFPTLPNAFKEVASGPLKDRHCFHEEKKPYAETPTFAIKTTWAQYYATARSFGKALLAVDGFKRFDSVSICGFNTSRWFAGMLGAILAGGLSVGSYQTNSPDMCLTLANKANSVVALCGTMSEARKYLAVRDQCPTLKHVVVFSDTIPADEPAAAAAAAAPVPAVPVQNGEEPHEPTAAAAAAATAATPFLLSWDDFLKLGASVTDEKLDERMAAIEVNDPVLLIPTSGTTGVPKCVMLTSDMLFYTTCASLNSISTPVDFEHHLVSYLPASHVAAVLADVLFPLYAAFTYKKLYSLYFAREDAMRGTLMKTIAATSPTFLFAVPRLWQKIAAAVKAKGAADPPTGCKRSLIMWAKEVGLENNINSQVGHSGDTRCCTCCASCMVHSKVKDGLALSRVTACYTGSAPLEREVFEFLASLGVPLLDLYGASETSGLVAVSGTERFLLGAVGCSIEGVEIRIDHVPGRDDPENGEILARGRGIMAGYLGEADKTQEAIDDEGWLHTGDVGAFELGMLKITGRLKELIIGSGAENIAPKPIEEYLKERLPAVSNVVMIGNNRKYNTCIISVQLRPNIDDGTFFDELEPASKAVDPECMTVADVRKSNKWKAYIDAALKDYNENGARSNAQKIQKWRIMPSDLSVPGGELTPTMKMRRSKVDEIHKALIDEMYAE